MDFTQLVNLVIEGLCIDGGHHKQWYLEEVLRMLDKDVEKMREMHDWDKGIAP